MSSYLTRHTFGQMWIWQATHNDAASFIPPDKYPVLHRRRSPRATRSTESKTASSATSRAASSIRRSRCARPAPTAPDCLTAPQVEAARKIYAGPKNPRTGEEIYSPLYPGSELGWATAGRRRRQPLGIPVEFFKYYVLRDPSWDYKTRPINFDSDVDARRTGRRSSR